MKKNLEKLLKKLENDEDLLRLLTLLCKRDIKEVVTFLYDKNIIQVGLFMLLQFAMTYIKDWLIILVGISFVQTLKVDILKDDEINREVVVWSIISVTLTFLAAIIGLSSLGGRLYNVFIALYKIFCISQLNLKDKNL